MKSPERHHSAETTTAASRRMTSPRASLSPLLLGPSIRLLSLVLAVVAIVHQPATAETNPSDAGGRNGGPAATAAPAATDSPDLTASASLPRPVSEMIDAILAAVHTGSIEELRTAIEWNELKPVFAPAGDPAADEDPIEFLKKASKDGRGDEMLAIIANLLSVAPARQPLGRDFENNTVYVWPYLAERPLGALTPPEEADLNRIVPTEQIAAMRAAGRWTWYRLTIGADGTWHSFMKHE